MRDLMGSSQVKWRPHSDPGQSPSLSFWRGSKVGARRLWPKRKRIQKIISPWRRNYHIDSQAGIESELPGILFLLYSPYRSLPWGWTLER